MRNLMMTKPVFTDEFKQGVVQYVIDHPDESKVSIAKRFGVVDSTIHKWMKDSAKNNGTIVSIGSGNFSSDEAKKLLVYVKSLKIHRMLLMCYKRLLAYWANNKAGTLSANQDITITLKENLQIKKRENRNLAKKIKAIHEESHEIYGAPKITVKLNQSGIKVSEKYVGNIMREMGIKAHYIKPYTITTKDYDFSIKLKNILKRNFNPEKPNSAWCTDITYIWTQEDGFVYLTSIMDLYSRKIIAWKLTKTMEVEEVLKCLEEAKDRRKTDNPVVIHSDKEYSSHQKNTMI